MCQTVPRGQSVLVRAHGLAKRSPEGLESRQKQQSVPAEHTIPGGRGITAHAHEKRTPSGPSPTSSHVHHSVWTRVCSWEHHRRSASTAPRLPLGRGRTEGPRPLACTWLPGLGGPAHLDVAIVWPSVAIHALYCGRLSLHQVDSEQRLESHWVVHVRVVGGQVHPANDEQAIHLWGADGHESTQGSGGGARTGPGPQGPPWPPRDRPTETLGARRPPGHHNQHDPPTQRSVSRSG